jgi:hypothetical protein
MTATVLGKGLYGIHLYSEPPPILDRAKTQLLDTDQCAGRRLGSPFDISGEARIIN